MVSFLPGTTQSQCRMSCVPSGFVRGFATNPCGWSLRQSFRSSWRRPRAMPDMPWGGEPRVRRRSTPPPGRGARSAPRSTAEWRSSARSSSTSAGSPQQRRAVASSERRGIVASRIASHAARRGMPSKRLHRSATCEGARPHVTNTTVGPFRGRSSSISSSREPHCEQELVELSAHDRRRRRPVPRLPPPRLLGAAALLAARRGDPLELGDGDAPETSQPGGDLCLGHAAQAAHAAAARQAIEHAPSLRRQLSLAGEDGAGRCGGGWWLAGRRHSSGDCAARSAWSEERFEWALGWARCWC
mmetsp:Transcript_50910/g.166365  ORF Transcript_50910/g.166365 Transcript_50910/m.166365 type:complete len:301 (+) Transcript_50910:733-1635(+)